MKIPSFCFVSKLKKTKGRLILLHGPCLQTHKVWAKNKCYDRLNPCTPRLSEWSRLGLASLSRRPELGLTWCHSSADLRNSAGFEGSSPSFLDSSHFSSVCNDVGGGNQESAKSEIRNNNSGELRNQRTCEAYKQFHFREATSNRLWEVFYDT